MDVVELVNKYGFPIVMAVGMGFIIKYVWEWATKEVKPVIGEANTVLIALIDRIRMLDNDLIRLNQKVNTVLHLRGKMIESDRVMEGVKVEREAAKTFDAAVRMDDPKPDLKDEEDINKKDETNKVRSIRYENNDDKGKN
jgi:hypothetical protein